MGKASYPVSVGEREAKAASMYAPISTKNSRLVCRRINRLSLEKAKDYLNALLQQRTDISGRYYTKAARHILNVLQSAEKNAVARGLGKLRVRTITAEQGPRMMRRKRKGGRALKYTHVKVVLEEVEKPKEEKKKR